MLTLNDGRTELWQWDTNRTLSVDADCSEVHFSNKVFGRSIDVDVVDGVAYIPDILLQTDKELNAWAFVGTTDNGYTKISKTFKVNRRNKPSDYVFTPTEQITWEQLEKRIQAVENRTETDPTVPAWAKQPKKPTYTAAEVGALPDTTKFPEKLPNPNPLTFTGAVNATYDGTQPVTVEIPQGDNWRKIAEFTLEEDTETGDVWFSVDEDENGKPLDLVKSLLIINPKLAENGKNIYYQAYKSNHANLNYTLMNLSIYNNATTVILCERINERYLNTQYRFQNTGSGGVNSLNRSNYPITGVNFKIQSQVLAGTTYEFWGVDR